MKRKGFTLIELLAVIVILAVIALIATPMIMDVIEKSKKGAAESSASGYISAVEQYKIVSQLDGDKSLEDGTYTVSELASYNIEVKGKKPSDGTVVISSGKIMDYQLQFDQYVVTYDSEQQKGVAEKKEYSDTQYPSYAIGTEVTLKDGSEWYVIEDKNATVSLFSKYNINVTTNKQDSTLTGDASDPQSVQFDDGSRNNENNTYCQLYYGTYYGCNAYAAVEGDYPKSQGAGEGSFTQYPDGTKIEYKGTVTEDSNIKNYVDAYVTSLNLGDALISSKLVSSDEFEKLGCSKTVTDYDDDGNFMGVGFKLSCEDTAYTWMNSTNYWMSGSYSNLGSTYAMDLSRNAVHQMTYVNEKRGVRPMIVVKKSAIQS